MTAAATLSLIVTVLCSLIVQSTSSGDERRLMKEILSAYQTTDARPVNNASDVVEITLGFSLLKILDFDQERHELSLLGWVEMDWTDVFARWQPSEYGDVQRIVLRPEMLWSPNIVLLNALERPTLIHDDFLTVKSNGQVVWTRELALKVFCDPKHSGSTKEPKCDVKMGTWTLTTQMISLKLKLDRVDGSKYIDNPDWEFYKTKAVSKADDHPCCPEDKFPAVTYTITLRPIPKEDEDADKDKDSGACALSSLSFASILALLSLTKLH